MSLFPTSVNGHPPRLEPSGGPAAQEGSAGTGRSFLSSRLGEEGGQVTYEAHMLTEGLGCSTRPSVTGAKWEAPLV